MKKIPEDKIRERIDWFIDNLGIQVNRSGAIHLIKEAFKNIIKIKYNEVK